MPSLTHPRTAQAEAAEKALGERDQQFRRYRIAKHAEYELLYADPVHGTRLRKFGATLNHFDIDDGDRLVEYVAAEGRRWLRAAPHDIRFAAGELVSGRIARIRARAGLAPFDDPLEDEPDDVRMLCRREIGLETELKTESRT